MALMGEAILKATLPLLLLAAAVAPAAAAPTPLSAYRWPTATGDFPEPVNATSTFTALGAGPGAHACALDSSGAAWCTGSNAAGQLGNGGFASADAFVSVSGGLTFTTITAGGSHSCGLTAAGAAYCWGSGVYGQLGNGQSGPGYNATAPVAVAGGLAFVSISAGVDHTCALTAAGKPYCFGHNNAGQLGTGSYANSATPVAVSGGLTFASISAGGQFTCARTSAGAAYCFGDGTYGQLGNGVTKEECVCGRRSLQSIQCGCKWPPYNVTAPVAVVGGALFSALDASLAHVCAIATNGTAFCWGKSLYGIDVMTGNRRYVYSKPMAPFNQHPGGYTASVTAGLRDCALSAQGDAYCWQFGEVVPAVPPYYYPMDAVLVPGGLRWGTVASSTGPTYGGALGPAPTCDSLQNQVYCTFCGIDGQRLTCARNGSETCTAFGKTVPLCTWVAATDDPWYKVPDPDPWRSFGGCPAYVQPNPKDRALYYYTGQGAQVPDPASATAQCTAFCQDVPGYTFQPNKTISNANLGAARAALSARQVAAVCDATPGCVGFTQSDSSGALLKSSAALVDASSPLPCSGAWVKQSVPQVPDCTQQAGVEYCSYCGSDAQGLRVTCSPSGQYCKIGNVVSRSCVDWAPEGASPIDACPKTARGALRPVGLLYPTNPDISPYKDYSPFYLYSSTAEPPAAGSNPCAASCDCKAPTGVNYPAQNVLQLQDSPVYSDPCSGSPSNGTVPRCVLFRDTGERRSVACAGQERTCFAKTMSGGWVFDKRCSATEPNVALRTTAQCQGDCTTLPNNRYCVYCSKQTYRLTCVQTGGFQCTAVQSVNRTVPLCTDYISTAPAGSCLSYMGVNFGGSVYSESFFLTNVSTSVPDPPSFNSAGVADPACPECKAWCTTPPEGYTFKTGVDSLGNNIGQQRTGLSPRELASLCNSTAGCVGFTSNGWLKAFIKPQLDPFPDYAWICQGLFIANVRPTPLCENLSSQRFCAHCAAGGGGQSQLCVAGGGVPCLATINGNQTLLQPCSQYTPVGGPVGTCFSAISTAHCGLSMPLQAGGTLAVALATTCPTIPSCDTLPANKYCKQCSADNEDLICVADGGASCTANIQGSIKLLMRCRDLLPVGGLVGTCLNKNTYKCKPYNLKAGGTLAAVQAASCSPEPQVPLCTALPANRYCAHCPAGGGGKPLVTCVAAGGTACRHTVNGVATTLELCSKYAPVGGPVGTCVNAISNQQCGQPLPLQAGGTLDVVLAQICPLVPDCSVPALAANRYCKHCSPSALEELTCVADGGQACTTNTPGQGGPKLLMRCRDLVPTGGPVGTCLNAVSSNCKQLPLAAGGTLTLVQATQCTPALLCSANDQRTFCAYCSGAGGNPVLCVSSGDVCVDTYKGVPTSFLKCTDMVPIAASRNGACPTTITSNSETLSFYAGNLRRDAAFASTCPTPQ